MQHLVARHRGDDQRDRRRFDQVALGADLLHERRRLDHQRQAVGDLLAAGGIMAELSPMIRGRLMKIGEQAGVVADVGEEQRGVGDDVHALAAFGFDRFLESYLEAADLRGWRQRLFQRLAERTLRKGLQR